MPKEGTESLQRLPKYKLKRLINQFNKGKQSDQMIKKSAKKYAACKIGSGSIHNNLKKEFKFYEALT